METCIENAEFAQAKPASAVKVKDKAAAGFAKAAKANQSAELKVD